jgi:hypothetical protein
MGQPPKGTYIATASGDYNVTGNWSGGIPNTINAEADFLSAITVNHTVFSDSAITAGRILFNNSHTYVLAGAGSLTLNSTASSARIDVQTGVQKITLPITIASNAVFNAASGSTLVIDAPVVISAGQTLTTAGNIQFLSTMTLQSGSSASLVTGSAVQSLSLSSSSTVDVIGSLGTRSALQLSGLSLAADATLNLNHQDMVLHGGDGAVIAEEIRAGNVTAGGNMAVGMIDDAVGGQPSSTSFDGTTVTTGDLLLRPTVYGDTTLKGFVDISDYTRLNAGYLSAATGWYNGDFNYDGVINGSDFTLIDNTYNVQLSTSTAVSPLAIATTQIAGTTSVPEPVAITLLGVSVIGLLGRRRRIF